MSKRVDKWKEQSAKKEMRKEKEEICHNSFP